MTSRPFVFFVVLTGISVLSAVVVVGFAVHPLPSSSSSSSFRAISTTLRYAAETNYHDEQYHRSRPDDINVVDVEVEANPQSIYIPLHEMEEAVNKAQENHEQDCGSLQNIIDEQQQELKLLKKRNQKSRLSDMMQYDHLAADAEVNWGENHEEKMKRTAQRVCYLTGENERLQAELDGERERFQLEKGRLKQKLEESRDETTEAQQILSLERSYFETAIKLLEVGLERETKNVKALEDQLMQCNQREFHGNHHHHPFQDDLPPFETWEGTVGYEQQQDHHHHHHHEFQHYPQHHEELFGEFQPQVRPQEPAAHYPQDSQHEASFQSQEPQHYHHQHDGNRRRTAATTTTVMGASSIRDNLGVNDILNSLYRK